MVAAAAAGGAVTAYTKGGFERVQARAFLKADPTQPSSERETSIQPFFPTRGPHPPPSHSMGYHRLDGGGVASLGPLVPSPRWLIQPSWQPESGPPGGSEDRPWPGPSAAPKPCPRGTSTSARYATRAAGLCAIIYSPPCCPCRHIDIPPVSRRTPVRCPARMLITFVVASARDRRMHSVALALALRPLCAQGFAARGYYTLAVAERSFGSASAAGAVAMPRDDLEAGLTLLGVLLFRNEPKPDAAAAIHAPRRASGPMVSGQLYSPHSKIS